METRFFIAVVLVLLFSCNEKGSQGDFKDVSRLHNAKIIDTLKIIANNKYIKLSKIDSISLLKEILYRYSLKRIDSCIAIKAFFYLFPSTNNAYNALYSDIEMKEVEIYASPYYESCEAHLLFLRKAEYCIDKEVFISKILSIGYNAKKWNSDMGFSLHDILIHPVIKSNIKTVIQVLKKKSDAEIYSFWQFYFDFPYPDNYFTMIDSNNVQEISLIDSVFYIPIEKAYNNALVDWENP